MSPTKPKKPIPVTVAGDKLVHITDPRRDLLTAGKPLAAHGQILVRFKNDAKSPTWDLNVVDSEGLAVEFKALKLTGEDTVTLKTKDGKITAEVE